MKMTLLANVIFNEGTWFNKRCSVRNGGASFILADNSLFLRDYPEYLTPNSFISIVYVSIVVSVCII